MSSSADQIKSYQNSISDMWQPTKTQLEGEQADIALLKTFFKNWEDTIDTDHDGKIDNEKTSKDGYNYALSEVLKKNNSNIPNSTITESQLLDKINKIFGKPLGAVTDFDVDKLKNDISTLQQTVKRSLALGFFCDSQIKNLNDKIDQLNQQTGEPLYGASEAEANPDGGEPNFLS